MDPIIVYVHGVGRQSEPAALKLEWDLALFGRDMGRRTRMAYWADLLHGTDDGKPGRVRGSGTGRVDVRAVLRAAGLEGPQALELGCGLARRLQGASSVGAQVDRLLPLPGFLRMPISKLFLETFIADTAGYFFRPGMRVRVQGRLRRALPPRGTADVLVAHSQGSIIAFEMLAKMETLRAHRFVTLGSPLGIGEIQDLLSCPRVVPESIERWINFAHRLDPVALDKGLGNDFEPRGAIDDEVLVNAGAGRFRRFNPHSAVGYLSHPRVRAVVRSAARFDLIP
jgi:hypothetical protein